MRLFHQKLLKDGGCVCQKENVALKENSSSKGLINQNFKLFWLINCVKILTKICFYLLVTIVDYYYEWKIHTLIKDLSSLTLEVFLIIIIRLQQCPFDLSGFFLWSSFTVKRSATLSLASKNDFIKDLTST